jgi:F0F1-type ATP synthase membrane subunit a
MFFFSPLEQFDVIYFFSQKFNLLNVFFIIFFLVFSIIFCYFFITFKLVPTSLQYFFELLYKFLLETLVQQAGGHSLFFFPFVFSAFFFILLSNLFGMLPFGFTITSHLSITFFLALGFNFGFFLLGLAKNGVSFFKLFLP